MPKTVEGRYRVMIYSEEEALKAVDEIMRDQGWPKQKGGRELIEEAIRLIYSNGYKVIADTTSVRLPNDILAEVVAQQD